MNFHRNIGFAGLLSLTLVVVQHVEAGVIDDIQPKMVKIFGAGGLKNLYDYSSGFLVSPEGHIATVWSPVLDAESVTVVLNDGRRFDAQVLGAEPTLDLAVLKIEGENLNLPCFDLPKKNTERFGPGTRVLAFSNMFKVATGDEPMSVIHGVIAARTRLSTRRGAFRTSYKGTVYVIDGITNNPGAGGGIVTNSRGQIVGMVGKELRNSDTNTWINYAIPLDEIAVPIEEIITGRFERSEDKPTEEDSPGRYRALDFGLVLVPDVLFRTPAFVESVIEKSPADRAGIRTNDLVMFINDELIQSCKDLEGRLGALEAGDPLQLIVRRNDQLVPFELIVPRKRNQSRD